MSLSTVTGIPSDENIRFNLGKTALQPVLLKSSTSVQRGCLHLTTKRDSPTLAGPPKSMATSCRSSVDSGDIRSGSYSCLGHHQVFTNASSVKTGSNCDQRVFLSGAVKYPLVIALLCCVNSKS